jgi:hypothetical protein
MNDASLSALSPPKESGCPGSSLGGCVTLWILERSQFWQKLLHDKPFSEF